MLEACQQLCYSAILLSCSSLSAWPWRDAWASKCGCHLPVGPAGLDGFHCSQTPVGLTLINHKPQCLDSYHNLKITPRKVAVFLSHCHIRSLSKRAQWRQGLPGRSGCFRKPGDKGPVTCGRLSWEGRAGFASCVFMLYDRSLTFLIVYFDFHAYDIFLCQNLFIFFKLN